MLRPFFIQLKNPGRLKIVPRFSWVHAQFKHDWAISENRVKNVAGKKGWKFSTFLADLLSWNFNSQSEFTLIPTTFFIMAYQADGSQEQLPQQQHEIQAPPTTAWREQLELDHGNTNEEEGNSFVANSLWCFSKLKIIQ